MTTGIKPRIDPSNAICPLCGGKCPRTVCRRLPWWPWVAPDGLPYIPPTEREYIDACLVPVSRWAGEGRQ